MRARILFTAILGLFASVALAGEYLPMPVSVNLDARIASGDMLTARFSKGHVEAIGCGATSIDDGAGGAFQYAFCEATDKTGTSVACFTLNPALVQAIDSISSFSFLFFAWDDDGITCTEIGTYTKSSFLSKRGKRHD